MATRMLTISGRRAVAPTRPRGRSLRLPASAFVAVALLVGAGAVTGAQAAGWWVSGGLSAASAGSTASGEAGGSGTERSAPTGADPAEVKGWMSVQQVVDAYGVAAAELFAAFGVPADTATSTALKDLEGLSDGRFEVTALRDWLAGR